MPKQRHSAKYIFAECQKKTLGKDVFYRVFLFAECIFLALGKHSLCRVPDKIHSAKPQHSVNRRFPEGVVACDAAAKLHGRVVAVMIV